MYNHYSYSYFQPIDDNTIKHKSGNKFLYFCLWFFIASCATAVLMTCFSNQPEPLMFRARVNTEIDSLKGQHTTIPEFESSVRQQDMHNINNTREKFGRAPVTEDKDLDTIAQARAKEAYLETLHHPFTDYYSHAEKPNDPYNRVNTARRLHLSRCFHPGMMFGENASKSDFKNKQFHNVVSRYGIGGAEYDANYINYEYVYNDASSKWGHRKNELNSQFSRVGVGCYYNPITQRNIMIELYTNDN